MPDALVTQLARALNLPPDAARHTLDHLVATLREQIDANGETRVPGLGTFHRDEEGVYFIPDDGLARAVNHRYAGLRPIEAGPASSRTEPEEEPEEEVAPPDPFAETPLDDAPSVEEERVEAEADTDEAPAEPTPDLPEPAIGFQPLHSFIEPEEPDEPEAPEDEREPEPSGALEEAEPEAPAPEPAAEVPLPTEPPVEELPVEDLPEEDLPEDEPPAFEEAPVAEEESPSDEELDEPAFEEPVLDEDDEDVWAGTWAEGPETPEGEHVLGPLPSEEIEEAEYDVVESDEAAAAFPPEMDHDDVWDEEPAPDDDFADEVIFDEEAEPALSAASPTPPPAEPPPLAEAPPPEPDAEPHAPEPAVADTAPVDREPVAQERRRGVPVFLTVVGVTLVLGVVALFWLLNREPDRPDVVERPVPADTATVAAVPPPTDTLASTADTAAVAAATPPEPEEPPAPADPLRGDAGIDPAAGGFTWVVASEVDRAVAERRVAQYREQGLRADVVAQEAGGRTRYRVSLGQFDTVAEAEARRSDLPPGVPSDSWILRL